MGSVTIYCNVCPLLCFSYIELFWIKKKILCAYYLKQTIMLEYNIMASQIYNTDVL